MGRAPCCDKDGLKKGPWMPEEDKKLVCYIQRHGYGNWRTLPKNAGLQRCGKSCRLRWTNYLRPDIKRGRFSIEEDEAIIHLHSILGNKWSAIAACLPGRTDNEIKNHWNTHIRKRLLRMGIDPVTHIPRLDLLDLPSILESSPCNTSHHMFTDISSLKSRVDPSINPELLKLAAYLGLSESENRDHAIQESQVVPDCQLNELYHSTSGVQENRFGNGPVPFPNEPQLVQPGISDLQLQPDSSNFIPDSSYSGCIYGPENLTLDPSSQNGYRNNLTHGASVDSTPSSSPTPLNSNSAYINGTGTEDEREIISYCSNYYDLMSYEIPEIMDVTELVELSQTV